MLVPPVGAVTGEVLDGAEHVVGGDAVEILLARSITISGVFPNALVEMTVFRHLS